LKSRSDKSNIANCLIKNGHSVGPIGDTVDILYVTKKMKKL